MSIFPALYVAWFRIKEPASGKGTETLVLER
jgi:hypothetical protein